MNHKYKNITKILTVMILSWVLGGCCLFPGKGMAAATQGKPSFEATYHYSLGVMLALDENLDGAIAEFETAIRLFSAIDKRC